MILCDLYSMALLTHFPISERSYCRVLLLFVGRKNWYAQRNLSSESLGDALVSVIIRGSSSSGQTEKSNDNG